jgi:hypothetical protein
MKNPEFVVWLQGYIELCDDDAIDIKKLRIIRNHLNLVKAVEGELSDINTQFFDLVSSCLYDEQKYDEFVVQSDLKQTLYSIMLPLFRKNFPEGYLESVDGVS